MEASIYTFNSEILNQKDNFFKVTTVHLTFRENSTQHTHFVTTIFVQYCRYLLHDARDYASSNVATVQQHSNGFTHKGHCIKTRTVFFYLEKTEGVHVRSKLWNNCFQQFVLLSSLHLNSWLSHYSTLSKSTPWWVKEFTKKSHNEPPWFRAGKKKRKKKGSSLWSRKQAEIRTL